MQYSSQMEDSKGSVNILLSTFKSEEYLAQQLASLDSQKVDYRIFVRDDHSPTPPILGGIDPKRIVYLELGRENIGPKESFLHLLRLESDSEFVSFCDQDDIWLHDRLSRAMNMIGISEIPTLYYSNAFLYENNKTIGTTNYHRASLPNSIFENSAMGCTIVMNRAAANLLKQYAGEHAIMHDWASLLIVLFCGQIVFDTSPSIFYRLHDKQTIGFRRDRSLKRIFSLQSLDLAILQFLEIVESFPKENGSTNLDYFYRILDLRCLQPRKFYFLLFFYPSRLCTKLSREVITRIKIISLSVSFRLKVVSSP
jgi:glycosyltransferase involved in cell wall biosynthesis